MNFKKLKSTLASYYKNLPGWRTNRKIVVIESDDWGSIRMPSKETYKKCLEAGYRVDQNPYEKYDALESEKDLDELFNVLLAFKDLHNKPPVITANALTSNPDFKKIKETNCTEYFFESVRETFNRYPDHSNCFNKWQDGMQQGVFHPQSHGREHLNVSKFMGSLQQGDNDALFALENEMPGAIPCNEEYGKNKYVEATRFDSVQDKVDKEKIIIDGLSKFKELFGFNSKSFIPTNYIWSPDFDQQVSENGVLYYQGNYKMKEPIPGDGVKLHNYYLGKTNVYGQRYLIRNAAFEPVLSQNKNQSFNECLRDVSIAFQLKKPAIISSHRLNYIGYIHAENREENLKLLNNLLQDILRKWPEVEFMTSDQLGEEIAKSSQ